MKYTLLIICLTCLLSSACKVSGAKPLPVVSQVKSQDVISLAPDFQKPFELAYTF